MRIIRRTIPPPLQLREMTYGGSPVDVVNTTKEDIDANDQQVIARVHQRAVGTESRVPVEADFWMVLTVRAEKVVRLDSYADKQPALEAAGCGSRLGGGELHFPWQTVCRACDPEDGERAGGVRGGVMNIDDFLKQRREAGQEVIVTEIALSPPRPYEVWGETVLVKPVAHAVSFVDEQGRAVTALIVGDQAGLAIMEGMNACPRWTDHDVSDPGVTL